MPKLNLDEMRKELFEDISVTIGGKEYTVGKVTADLLKMEGMGEDVDACGRQLEKMFGVKEGMFAGEDIRILTKAYQFVMESITEQLKGSTKNPSGTEGEA